MRLLLLVGSTTGLALVSGSFLLGGCSAAEPADPAPGGGSGSGGTGGTSGGVSCDINALLQKSCWGIGCHGMTQPAAELDMQTAGVEARLLNIPASHLHILPETDTANCTPGELRIDGNNPENSVLLKKLYGTQSCGGDMPVAPRTVNA
ncbi:MAG TPA: hypothetical protein VM686_05480, partial [Polyangiaceae bacterium]|nr:hypothetical protein [Polyangiaceae bacterium]